MRMKLLIQIPCWNEEEHIAATIDSLPKNIPGIDSIEVVVIDDGSHDRTALIAEQRGVRVIKLGRHMGLAGAFNAGMRAAIDLDADILVNTDADMQYPSQLIPNLVAPLLTKSADIVIGNRLDMQPPPFTPAKMFFEHLGSFFMRSVAGVAVRDAASGFRAFNRGAIQKLFIHGRYTYTLESLMVAGIAKLRIENIPITINPATRPSRLFRSIPGYIGRSIITVMRAYLMYHPLQFFMSIGIVLCGFAAILGIRYLSYFFSGEGAGHVQSLVLLAIFAAAGFLSAIVGMLGDVIAANRKLLEDIRMEVINQSVSKKMNKEQHD